MKCTTGRLARYEQALSKYLPRKEKWDFYITHIQPYNLWSEKYKEDIEKVEQGIERHNQARIARLNLPYYRRFWDIKLNAHREDESKVVKTVPGQILSGGDLRADSQSFINDRSVVIAGQTMVLKKGVQNIDEIGLHRVTDTGKKVYTFDKW